MPRPSQAPTGDGLGIGFVVNFFDTLGIGSFATTTASVKFRNLVRDELLPGTLNVGHALPTIVQAIIFTTAIAVAPLTLISMVAAAVAGGFFGAGVVSRLARRSIQLGMGIALLIAAFIVKSLPLAWLYWLVVIVVLCAAILMLRSALQPQPAADATASHAVQKPVR
jgi:uncharacterized membrane protein YfcA